MDKAQLIAHLKAHSATYSQDAAREHMRGNTQWSTFYSGKSEAFATAASWLEVSGV